MAAVCCPDNGQSVELPGRRSVDTVSTLSRSGCVFNFRGCLKASTGSVALRLIADRWSILKYNSRYYGRRLLLRVTTNY